jgi:hypothetical protein
MYVPLSPVLTHLVQAMKGFLEVFGTPDPTSAIGWNISPTVPTPFKDNMLTFTGSTVDFQFNDTRWVHWKSRHRSDQ